MCNIQQSRTLTLFIAPLLLALSAVPTTEAADLGSVEVGGAYAGLVNSLRQDNRTAEDGRRDQFDFAVNLDFGWQLRDNVEATVQLQGGPGGGSFGLVGPEANVTDVNLAVAFPQPDVTLTVGSFDTPFGEETGYLTNNGDSFANAFFLNSLFYCVFADSHVGTLNTLGVMAVLATEFADFTAAVTNGTEEAATNGDGDFELVARVGLTPGEDRVRLAGSVIYSDESGPVDTVFVPKRFSGWMAEARLDPIEGAYVKGYYGMLQYWDGDGATEDDLGIWMAEARYGQGPWYLAGRMSAWMPEDDNGDGVSHSAHLPLAGLTLDDNGQWPVPDQQVTRLQVGGGFSFDDNLMLKAAYFRDDYDKETNGKTTDVEGFIVSFNGRF